MLTSSGGHYLPPDFLQPLPTTLDAKNSPLALLAQTCSSIGKDTAPTKSIIPPLEKKKENSGSEKSNSSLVDGRKSSPSGHLESGRQSQERSKSNSSENKDVSYYVPKTDSPEDKRSRSESPHAANLQKSGGSCTNTTSVITKPISSSTQDACKTDKSNQRPARVGSPDQLQKDSPPPKMHRSRSPTPVYASAADFKLSDYHPHSIYSGLSNPHLAHTGLSLGSHGFPMDAMSAHGYPSPYSVQNGLSFSHASALEAHAALKSAMPSLSPYVQYARMRNQSGATTLVPICRDPYCTHCQLSIQNSHLSSTCSAPGCTQCAHEKSLQSLSALGLAGANPSHFLQPGSLTGGLPSAAAGLSSLHSLSSFYSQSLLAQQGLPYACNWVSGNDYCGKRFTTSEELLHHLRTHTSGMDSALPQYGPFGLFQGFGDYSALHGYLGSAAGNLSPGSLRRMYPTSVSPLASSTLHSTRYHPYKSALPSMPSGLPSGQSLSSIGPHYNIYGQRIGAAIVP